MSEYQQNKQRQQPKRNSNLKFLSIKSVIRNKKLVVKKAIPIGTFYPRANNVYSTCELAPKVDERFKDEHSQRVMTNCKQATLPVSSTNVVNIKFGDEISYLHKQSDHKIRRKYTNSFNLHCDDVRKTSVKEKMCFGAVEDSLIIEPLQKIQSQFGWDRKKGFYNYMAITNPKKPQRNMKNMIMGHETLKDFRQMGKGSHTTSKQKIPKQFRTTVTFMPFSSKIQCDFEEKPRKERKDRSALEVAFEKLDKAKEKEATDALLKEFRQILPLRKPSNKKDHFVFSMSQKSAEPENKIELYRDFLWKVNYSNGLFVYTPENIEGGVYKAYIGFGNNSCMLKSILRRRTWWALADNSAQADCNFVWTQLKVNSLFKTQKPRVAEIGDDQSEYFDLDNLDYLQSEEVDENLMSHLKIFNRKDMREWSSHIRKNMKTEQKITELTHLKRIKLYSKKAITKIMDSTSLRVYNHLEFNYFLGNKKALFYNIKRVCQMRQENPFEYIPLTFHISKGTEDPVYQQFLEEYRQLEELKKVDKNFRNIWICKPGENTNRGNGISVCSGLDDVRHRLRGREKNGDGKPRTFILQKYIEKPFLYKNRKFDIRHYILITCFNGNFKAYWFEQGYVRTSSSIFSLKNSNDLMVHLTNDAVQKKGETYGKHEKGNKVSYEDFQKYLDANYKKKYDFLGNTLGRMKKIARTAVQATYYLLDPGRKENNFELIGLDFMIDQNFKPWLIEANTNPCLQLSSPLLEKLIPNVIQQTFRMCVDPFFPPPENISVKNRFFGENALTENRFELIFDESVDGERIQRLVKEDEQKNRIFNQLIGKIEEDDELFEDDGNDNWQQKQKNTN